MKQCIQLILLFLSIIVLFPACEDPVIETPEMYTIAFDKNDVDAKGSMAVQVITEGKTEPLSECEFTKTDCIFAGWSEIPHGPVFYSDGQEYTMGNTNVILYAQWTHMMGTVTFDSRGGSPVPSQKVRLGSPFTEPDSPTRADYGFAGWFREPECHTPWDFLNDRVMAHITLYTQWIEDTEGLEFTPVNNNTEYSVTKGTADTNGSIAIPDYYNGKKVTALGDQAFLNCSGLVDLIIPDSVTTIGDALLRGCTHLRSITLPEDFSSIEKQLFLDCSSLEEPIIPNSVISIGDSAFQRCTSIEKLTIPENVESIGDAAFVDCHSLLELVVNPIKPPVVDSNFLLRCESLTGIFVSSSESRVLYKKAPGWSEYSDIIFIC